VRLTKIKFCGLTRPVDAAHAASLGASFAGVVFAESPRKVTPDRAREIFDASPELRRVGVFGLVAPSSLLRDALDAELDVIQLHGHFTPDEIMQIRQEFEGELWSVVPVDQATGKLADGWKEVADLVDALLLDTRSRGGSGGTGRAFNWARAAKLLQEAALDIRIVLAGGLTPANVAEGISTMRPAIVDVSSGVESAPGIKDPALMAAFAKAVRSASIV
jgi:phosphoribosylanthranilate isomerase